MLTNEKKNNLKGQGLLLLSTLIWGTTFLLLKNTIDSIPVMFVLFVRFFTSAAIVFALFFKKIIKMPKRTLAVGLALGGVLSAAYLFQTYGLKGVSPGENAFLTSTYTVMVPFMAWAVFRKKPNRYSFIAAALCIAGIGCVAFYDGFRFTVGLGQILTLVCAVFYGLQIIIISVGEEKDDPVCLLFVQLAVVGVVCGAGSLIFEMGKAPIVVTLESALCLAYLTLFGTLLAQGGQMIGQKYVSASHASLLLSFESVFGLLFSVLFGGEELQLVSCIGFVLVFLSVIVSETQLQFLTKRFQKKKK
ncbi:MAG: DMT family transporter [Clostridia bacterium]|nr:DMT family transporter [Clostridia bacterium]